jgi:CheY-like chemotaxis protein
MKPKMKTKKPKRPKISILHEEIPHKVQELIQLTKMAEIGRISASIAHEINNPLMVAQGFAENIELLLDSKDFSHEELRMQILEIIKACQRMTRVINKMNRMSRKQELRLTTVDMAEVALNAVEFVKTQMDDQSIKLEFDFNKPLPVHCDPVQIEQIILNILSNAIHALGRRRQGRCIKISFSQVGGWQQMKIWNNGPLIPLKVRDQIMAPFFTTKCEGEGMGLGLAVSKAIMHVHGADLSFTSDRSIKGTEFRLSFPAPKEHPWHESRREEKGCVVIIDRQLNFRRALQEKFRLLGFKVAAFPDTEAAKAVLNKPADIAAVVVDVVPGELAGLDFVRQLRHRLGPTGLIFAMSNFASARDLKGELQAAGATGYFEKPFDAESFSFIIKLLDSATLDAVDKASA